MGTKTKRALGLAVVEKDVENAYREAIHAARPGAIITSPHNTDGYARWGNVRLLLEAKLDQDLEDRIQVCGTLGQCLLYLKRFESSGDPLPNVILVGDRDECFVLSTAAVKNFMDLPIDWSVAPSKGNPELVRALVDGLNILPYVYGVDDNFDFGKVISECETLASGSRHFVRATTTNIGAIFLYWADKVFRSVDMSATEQVDVFLRCLFQPADVYMHPTRRGVLVVPGYRDGVVISSEQYKSFFSHFQQGYRPSEIEEFYGMKDRLVEDDARRRQGAFFTPPLWVAEAHGELDRVLGPSWRQDCVVWDSGAGTANLTKDYHDWGLLISSTAELSDVAVMQEHGWGGDHVFHHDFLNPGAESPFFEPGGEVNTIPPDVDAALREAARCGKRLVWMMNPPYAEHSIRSESSRAGIANTSVNKDMIDAKMGLASRQLYAQFMWQCTELSRRYGFDDFTVATFSKPTFMCSGSYRRFRGWWYDQHSYEGGFMFRASHFSDVSGAWGISFTVWNGGGTTDSGSDLSLRLVDVVDFSVVETGTKTMYVSSGQEASKWVREGITEIERIDVPQLSSGLKLKDGHKLSRVGSLFCFNCHSNVMQQSGSVVCLVSSMTSMNAGVAVVPKNWRRAVALYGARKLVKGSWVDDKDEYLVPDDSLPGYERWVDDCHVYSLLHTSNNCTSMRDVQYKGKSWRIKNHWFWLSRSEALCQLDTSTTPGLWRDCRSEPRKHTGAATSVWEVDGDPYLAYALPNMSLSPDAQDVLTMISSLWSKSLSSRESYAAGRPELNLMAWDAGVYQLKHLWRDLYPEEWKRLVLAHRALAERLRRGVYTYGFLRR